MKNYIISHRYAIFFVIFFAIFLPISIALPAQTDTRAIVTGISIDKKEDKYNVALQLITPQSNISNNENLQIVEDEGDSVFDCINNLGIKLGKYVGLEHTNIMIIGDGLQNDDLMNLFDYLYRSSKITLSTIIVYTDGDAKQLLETSAELNNNSSSSLQNNLGFNTGIIETSQVATLGSFFNDYFSYSSLARVPLIEVKQKEENSNQSGGQSSSEQSGGGQSQNSGQNSSSSSQTRVEPLVQNNGESVLYHRGKFVKKLSKDLTNGFSWLDSDTSQGVVRLKGVTDNKYFKNADLSVKIEHSTSNLKYKIEDGRLVCYASLKLNCNVSEIINNEQKTSKIVVSLENYLTPTLKNLVAKEVEKKIMDSHNYAKELKFDVFNFIDKFYKHDRKGLIKVLGNYGENYLEATDLKIKIDVQPYK